MKPSTEEYAALRVTLESALSTPAVIVVGAATDEDGAGTVACHLSKAFADSGYRTVVVDSCGGDLLKAELGLKIAPTGEIAAIPGAAVNGTIRNLSAVVISPSAPHNTTSYLKMRSIMSEFRAKYDITIINAGKIAQNAAALQFAAVSEGVILGFRFGRKPVAADQEVTSALRRVGAKLLGVVAIGRDADRRPEPVVRAAEDAGEIAVAPPVKIAMPTLPVVAAPEVATTR